MTMRDAATETPFSLTGTLDAIPNRAISRPMEALLERVLSLKKLDRLYSALAPCNDQQMFLKQVFELFNIHYQVADEELARIPRSGPLVMVANHPFGAIEGVIMAALLRQVRPDVKIMANFVLKRIPELRELFIAVDPFGGAGAARSNIGPMKEALRWLKQGGLLLVFPAGEVSNFKPFRGIEDSTWSRNIGRLIQLAQAPAQPVYFHGANSLLFQLAGLMHPLLRTVMLPRELLNKTNTTIPIRIGKVQSWSRLKQIEEDQALIDYLRMRTYMLRNSARPTGGQRERGQTDGCTLIAPVEHALLRQEVDALPEAQRLVDGGALQVYCATAGQAPHLLREIGRLRELSFRAAGEGTGRALDLDAYDAYYLHLFIWNRDTDEVVGAYRLGEADRIIASRGVAGLYSHSLFRYSRRLIDQLNPALELGRSFVRQEYQKSFAPLLLLWKGIATFVHRNPRYRRLFGPVSISSDYQPLSQKLLVDFLRIHNSQPTLAKLVKPRSPFRARAGKAVDSARAHLDSVEAVDDLIAELEADGKGIPVLLRQYLKFGGQILAFNVDDQFNNSLDGLIMVDLLQTEFRTLTRYMGKAETAEFHAWHGGEARQAG